VLVAVVGILLLLLIARNPSLALWLLYSALSGGRGFGARSGSGGASGGGFGGGGGRSGGGGARGRW
jgi:uncharacterized membrane protein YgcG